MEQVANDFRRKLRLAYDLAPWRQQTRVVALVMLALVVAAVLAAFYLDVSAKTARLGRMIQEMQLNLGGPKSVTARPLPVEVTPMEELQMQIAGLRVKLALLQSEENILERAARMDFKPVEEENIVYIRVPGYQERRSVQLAPPNAPQVAPASAAQPLYRDSLQDALQRNWKTFLDTITREARR